MQVTTAMLADAATESQGKLYIQGGGWNTLVTTEVPTAHPALGLVLTFKLDWHEANEDVPILIELVDEDDKPLALRGEGILRVAPTHFAKKGDHLYQSVAHMFYGLTFDKLGSYRFRVSSQGKTLASIPLTIISAVR